MYPLKIRFSITFPLIALFFPALNPVIASALDEGRLRKGEVLFVFEDKGTGQIPEGHAAGLINCQPQEVWKILNDYNNLKNTIPGVVESRIDHIEGDVVYYYEKTHVPILKDNWYVLRCVQDDKNLEKTMTRVEGSVRYLESRWSVKPFDDRTTLAEYSIRCDPGFYLPRWTQRFILRRTIEGIFEGLRKASCNRGNPEP